MNPKKDAAVTPYKENLSPNLRDDDLDINLSNIEECKYYSVDDFKKTKLVNNINIFHNNVNG